MQRIATIQSARAASRRAPLALVACFSTPKRQLFYRTCPWGSDTKPSAASAVNVEEFTLNEDVVKRDLEAQSRWQAFEASLTAAKTGGDPAEGLRVLEQGRALLAELGPDSSPVLCDVMLALEEAQLQGTSGQVSEAIACCERAIAVLAGPTEKQNLALIAEVKELKGRLLLQAGEVDAALALFLELKEWIDRGCAGAPPMVTVAAKAMRRNVMTGLGLAYQAQAAGSRDKVVFDKALTTLIDALNAHIEEGDVTAVKHTLHGALQCFVGLGDTKQAVETCEKYISWCRRHNDAKGVEYGEAQRKALQDAAPSSV